MKCCAFHTIQDTAARATVRGVAAEVARDIWRRRLLVSKLVEVLALAALVAGVWLHNMVAVGVAALAVQGAGVAVSVCFRRDRRLTAEASLEHGHAAALGGVLVMMQSEAVAVVVETPRAAMSDAERMRWQ